jgi:hypothetical protein
MHCLLRECSGPLIELCEGTITRIGFVGQVCALAAPATTSARPRLPCRSTGASRLCREELLSYASLEGRQVFSERARARASIVCVFGT